DGIRDRNVTGVQTCALPIFHLYVCHRLSVDGSALGQLLQRLDCDVKLWRFEPDHFLHAKLIGVIWGDEGRMLSGSANLSRAAMRSEERRVGKECGTRGSADG